MAIVAVLGAVLPGRPHLAPPTTAAAAGTPDRRTAEPGYSLIVAERVDDRWFGDWIGVLRRRHLRVGAS